MLLEIELKTKGYLSEWSNQKYSDEMPDSTKYSFDLQGEKCILKLQNDDSVKAYKLFYLLWELLFIYDGYFYKPVKLVEDGENKYAEMLIRYPYYSSDQEWINSATLIGRSKRDLSPRIIEKYKIISSKDRRVKSLNRSMFSSYFYTKSEAYHNINIEHRLLLLMCICDGVAINLLQQSRGNNSGNISFIAGKIKKHRVKKGAGLLGIDESKAIKAIGSTRNELTHFDYQEEGLSESVRDQSKEVDDVVNLYLFYVLDTGLRIAILEALGFLVEDEVKDYFTDNLLDWIKIEKDLEEDCTIPANKFKQGRIC